MFSAGGDGGVTQNRLVPVLTRRASRLWRSVPNALRLVEPKGSHRSSLFQNKQKSPHKAGCFVYGGEGGIRTLDTLLTYTPLAGERLQPLGHFSTFFSASLLPPARHYRIAHQSLSIATSKRGTGIFASLRSQVGDRLKSREATTTPATCNIGARDCPLYTQM